MGTDITGWKDDGFALAGKEKSDWWKRIFRRTSGSLLMFLVALPPLTLHMLSERAAAAPLLWLLVPTWLVIFALWWSTLAVYCRHPLAVKLGDGGLTLLTPGRQRTVRWSEMKELIDTGEGEQMLDTTSGAYFLSGKLTKSEELFAAIRKQLPAQACDYLLNSRIDEEFPPSIRAGMVAVLTYPIFALGRPLLLAPHSPIQANDFLIAAAMVAFVVGYGWVIENRVPRLVRVSRSGIYVRTRSESRFINWSQIVSIKQPSRHGMIILNTQHGWYVFLPTIMGHTGELRGKLLETRDNLKALKVTGQS